MPKWNVTIKATVTKTITDIEADTEDEAIEIAHSLFTVAVEDGEEDYDEQTEDVERIDEPDVSDEDAELDRDFEKAGRLTDSAVADAHADDKPE
jgi:hypothetical protein